MLSSERCRRAPIVPPLNAAGLSQRDNRHHQGSYNAKALSLHDVHRPWPLTKLFTLVLSMVRTRLGIRRRKIPVIRLALWRYCPYQESQDLDDGAQTASVKAEQIITWEDTLAEAARRVREFEHTVTAAPYEAKGVFFSEIFFVLAAAGNPPPRTVFESGRARGVST